MLTLSKIYYGYVFLLVNVWYVLLLWGLIRDTSLRSRVLRLLAAFFLYKTANSKIVDYNSGFYIILEQTSKGLPIWLIGILSLLLLVVIYGYIELYKEKN